MSSFANTLLCLDSTHFIVKFKFGFEFGLFAKQHI